MASLSRRSVACESNKHSYQNLSLEQSQQLLLSDSHSSTESPINQDAEQCSPYKTEETKEPEDGDRVKTKLISMWNNVRYSWNFKTKTHFSKDSPIWLLGRIYHQSHKTDDSSSLPTNNFEALKSDFFSRIWLTYRKEFPVLNGSYYTSDCGWGCMLRSGQMLLAQALVCHFLGRDWRWNESGAEEQQTLQESLHRMIVQWFGDKPSPACPLSIHQMVSQGHISAGKRPGDWYGPSSVSYIIKQILQRATDTYPELDTLRVYIAQDCTVYLDDVKQSCSKSCNYDCDETDYELIDDQWKSLILLIPLRLGGERMNPTYDSCLKGLLSLEQCIGIIGGKPKHSQYFIGWQDDFLIHLDPHNCQEMVDVLIPNFHLKSFHCHELRKTALKQVDPSCCVGFYLRSQREFDEFRRNVQHYLVPPQSKGDYPIFAFSSGSSPHVDDAWFQQNEDSLSPAARQSSACGPSIAGDNYLDDFEIL